MMNGIETLVSGASRWLMDAHGVFECESNTV